jgi:hypothetical protein
MGAVTRGQVRRTITCVSVHPVAAAISGSIKSIRFMEKH